MVRFYGAQIDGGDGIEEQKQSPTPKPASFASFKKDDYLDYRTGEKQRITDEQTKIAGQKQSEKTQAAAELAAKRAAEDAQLAADREAAKKAQEDAKEALAKAKADYQAALDAKAKAAADEAARKANENKKELNPITSTFAQSSSVSTVIQNQAAPRSKPPTPTPPPPPPPPVKTAPIDTILFDDTAVPIEIMTDLIFEDIGGQEIISMVRSDTINGQNIIYQPIKNLSLINQQYSPNNILALQGTSDKYFENFIIKLSNKIPSGGNGPDGKNVYINNDTLDIIIDLINIEQDEQTEFQFRIDGTIYEAEL